MALPEDWSYKLAEEFLDAAVSCNATCARRFVGIGLQVEGPPPDCPCQLVVTVTEGWSPAAAQGRSKCGKRRVATVKLTLDVCTSAPGQNELPDPVKVQTAARDAATLRWRIMEGLNKARAAGRFCGGSADGWPAGATVGCCDNVTPGPWRPVRTDWGSARWEATWEWSENA